MLIDMRAMVKKKVRASPALLCISKVSKSLVQGNLIVKGLGYSWLHYRHYG